MIDKEELVTAIEVAEMLNLLGDDGARIRVLTEIVLGYADASGQPAAFAAAFCSNLNDRVQPTYH
jgi:hypothetical protein